MKLRSRNDELITSGMVVSGDAAQPQPAPSHNDEVVSVVVPCYNEERFIEKALKQLADQYDKDRYEIIVIDGRSEDKTRTRVQHFIQTHPEVTIKLIDNPVRNIPTGLNIGIAAARGAIIARMDAHAVPSSDYIRRCVEVLRETDAGIVGMPCHVQAGADTPMAKAIAQAVSHPFGIGDAKYRLRSGGAPQEKVDTVAFACFRKNLWSQLGGYDETLLTNEDYDFNYRVRLLGQDVILDRSEHCDYFARTNLRDLAVQYFRYGGWKAEMVRLHPRSIKLRHLVAPAFVLSLLVLTLAGIVWSLAWWLLLIEVVIYFSFALVAGWRAASRAGLGLRVALVMPAVFATIHLTWGISFLIRLFVSARK